MLALSEAINFLESKEKVTDISVNSNGFVYYCEDGVWKFFEKYSANEIDSFALEIAGQANQYLNEQTEFKEISLPNGNRISIFHSPLTENCGFVIRILRDKKLPLRDFIIDDKIKEIEPYLLKCLETKKNILISGATGSGKTTFLSSLLGSCSKEERIVLLEDTREIVVHNTDNYERLCCGGNSKLNMQDLVRLSLRMCPHRIIIGEMRGAEAYDLCSAWNSGHCGCLSTIHANSATAALTKLKMYARQSGYHLEDDFFDSVNTIIHLEKFKIKEIMEYDERELKAA